MADGKDEKVRAAEPTADVIAAEACPYKPGVRNEETSGTPANSTIMTEADAQTNAVNTEYAAVATDGQSGPALPQRNYARDPRALAYSYGQSQPIPPNTFLPRFLKGLAWFILLGGSLATLSAALYQVRTDLISDKDADLINAVRVLALRAAKAADQSQADAELYSVCPDLAGKGDSGDPPACYIECDSLSGGCTAIRPDTVGSRGLSRYNR